MKRGINIWQLIGRVGSATCPVCGGAFEYNPRTGKAGQWAHFIPDTIPNRKRYGKVIASHWNGITVCGLACNNAVQVSPKSWPLLADEIAEYVRKKENL